MCLLSRIYGVRFVCEIIRSSVAPPFRVEDDLPRADELKSVIKSSNILLNDKPYPSQKFFTKLIKTEILKSLSAI